MAHKSSPPNPIPAGLRARDLTELECLTHPIVSHTYVMDSRHSSVSETSSGDANRLISSQVRAAATLEEAAEIITVAIQFQLSSLTVVDSESIDSTSPLYKYGIDSLVAVEPRNWFAERIGADVTTIEILADVKIAELARNVAKKIRFVKEEFRVQGAIQRDLEPNVTGQAESKLPRSQVFTDQY